MEVIPLDRWSEFQGALDSLPDRIRAKYDVVRQEEAADGESALLPFRPRKALYRGQSNSAWNLETTLERQTGRERYSIGEYVHSIRGIHAQIESYTGESWLWTDHLEDLMV